MAAIVVPALKRHTSSVIVMHGLGDRYVDMHYDILELDLLTLISGAGWSVNPESSIV